MKKYLEEKHKKSISELKKTLMEKQLKKIEPIKTEKKREKKFSIKQPDVRSNIIGLLLLIAGVILLINPSSLNIRYSWALSQLFMNPAPLNLKISIVLVLIGFFLILLIGEKKTPKDTTYKEEEKTLDSKKKRLLTSEKIVLILSIWIVFLFLITSETQIETLFVLTFIGTLVVKELSDEYTTRNLKMRMNVFISIFLITFVAIILQKIINILNI